MRRGVALSIDPLNLNGGEVHAPPVHPIQKYDRAVRLALFSRRDSRHVEAAISFLGYKINYTLV